MEIIKQPDLFLLLKDKHILLDTSLLIDTLLKPSIFAQFFQELKENGAVITSIDPVAFEFLKGALDEKRYNEKKKILDGIIDAYLPVNKDIFNNVYAMLKELGEDGKGIQVTDLLLGGMLMQYPKRLFLFTKNATDFPLNFFELVSVFNFPSTRSIQTYGVYTYNNSE